MSVSEVQQRIALIQATVGNFASGGAGAAPSAGFADQLTKVMRAQSARSYDATGDVGRRALTVEL